MTTNRALGTSSPIEAIRPTPASPGRPKPSHTTSGVDSMASASAVSPPSASATTSMWGLASSATVS